MRPAVSSLAHRSAWFAELVCSNSLGSEALCSGKGLLKAELVELGSNLLFLARRSRVPAGKALAVDREIFGCTVTGAVRSRANIRVTETEARSIPVSPLVILACGPLPSDALSDSIRSLLGGGGAAGAGDAPLRPDGAGRA